MKVQALVNGVVREERTFSDGPQLQAHLDSFTLDLLSGDNVTFKVVTDSKAYVLDDEKSNIQVIKERLW